MCGLSILFIELVSLEYWFLFNYGNETLLRGWLTEFSEGCWFYTSLCLLFSSLSYKCSYCNCLQEIHIDLVLKHFHLKKLTRPQSSKGGTGSSFRSAFQEEAWKRYNRRMQEEYEEEMERVVSFVSLLCVLSLSFIFKFSPSLLFSFFL